MSRDLLLITISLFVWGAGEGLFVYFQPIYLQQWGANPVAIGAILSGMGIAMTVAQAPAGYLADRFGRRPVMWSSWILGMLSAWVMALAPSLDVFIVGILAYGLTSFVLAPMNSYITGARGKWSVSRALTVASASYQLGAVLGPLAGGSLGQIYGLQFVYQVAAAIFVLSTLLVLLVSPQPIAPPEVRSQEDHLLRNPRFAGFLVIAFFTFFSTYLPQPLTPNFLQNERGLTILEIGRLGSIGSLGNALLALGLGRLDARLAFLLGQGCVALFSILLWRGSSLPMYAAGYFFFGGYRVCRSIALALTRPLVRSTEMGLAYGFVETANSIAVILAPLAAGVLYDHGPEWIYPVALGALVISLLGSGWAFSGKRLGLGEAEKREHSLFPNEHP